MNVGILFSVCDGPLGDEKHFDRFFNELTRLGYPFAVNFDHCTGLTKRRFQQHPLYTGGFENDDPSHLFGEDHRQPALEILQKKGFDWALTMDVDETLEKDAPRKIQEVIRTKDLDVVDVICLDLWGDPEVRPLTYRVDNGFASSHREKLFNLKSPVGPFAWTHPTIHAPKITERSNRVDRLTVKVKRHPIHILHWGIMDENDISFHTERWNRIYTQRVGGNPYKDGFYNYINDSASVPILRDVPAQFLTD